MKQRTIHTAGEVMLAILMAVSVRAATLDEVVRREVLRQNHLDSQYYQIEVLASHLKHTDLADLTAVVRPVGTKEPLGMYTVAVTLKRGDSTVETGQVNLKIRKFADVLIALRPLDRHESLSPENTGVQWMDISSLFDQPVVSWQEVANRRLSRAFGKGQVLVAGAMEPIPDIEVGREVAIICTDGVITVSASGQALQKGSAGDYVKVKNKSSGKIVVGRVIDPTTVAILP